MVVPRSFHRSTSDSASASESLAPRQPMAVASSVAFQQAYGAQALARGLPIAEGWALDCTDSASLVSVIPKGRPELGSKSQR